MTRKYVPILKWKQGEAKALECCSPSAKQNLLPLIELATVPWDHDIEAPSKSCDEHLAKFGAQLAKSWPLDSEVFIDALHIEDDTLATTDTHPLTNAMNQARAAGVNAIPVTSPSRNAAYQNAAISSCNDELCVRIGIEDVLGTPSPLLQCLSDFSVSPSNCHIVVDLRTVSPEQEATFIFTAQNIINQLPYVNDWKSLTLAATSFPDSMASVNTGIDTIDRTEWSIWNALRNSNAVEREPWFGDYTISGTDIANVNPRLMQPTANIRYAADNEWYIFKGRSLRRNGYDQFQALSDQLIKHPCYDGNAFSWADGYIYECANKTTGNGNLTTWRQVGTNRHIEKVLSQIAMIP